MEKAKKIVPEGWFKWERPGIDFPFYDDDSVPARHGWLLLGVSLFVAVALNVSVFLPVDRSVFKIIVVFLIPLVTLLYVAHGNIGTVIKKPRLGDIPLIIVVVVLDMLYSFAMGALLQFALGIQTQANAAFGEAMDAGFFALLFVGLAHYAAYGSLVQILLIQGLGSIICLFAYIKTKNMLVTYAAHLIIDLIPFGLAAAGALSAGTTAAALILL